MSWLKRALPAAALAVVLTTPARAQISGHTLEISGGLGIAAFDTRSRLKDAPAFSGALGYRLASWFEFELSGLLASTKADTAPQPDASLLYGALDMRLNVRPAEDRLVPFVLVGMGYARSTVKGSAQEKLARGAPSLGAGLLVNLMGNSRAYLRLQARDIMFRERDAKEFSHDVAATVSLQYLFGGSYRDRDLDKVRDWIDRCPGTEIGAVVDANGCPSDADRDSVVDGIDKCPDTPTGCKVDRTGCPIDTDGDGVCDGLDRSPDTPKGAKVDATGATMDSDGDGVLDGLDQCENTPKGATIDVNGCPVDGDGDGVPDGLDTCADTPAGAQVDDKGCMTKAATLETDLLETGTIVIRPVAFEGARLAEHGNEALDALAELLSRWPELKIEISAHTDGQGSAAVNRRLSQERADAVKAYLVSKVPGINAANIVARGYGGSRPVASNETEAGRALNRRIEIEVQNKAELVKAGGKRRVTR